MFILSDYLYVPDHWRSFLGVSALGQKGENVVFDDICELRCFDEIPFPFVQKKDLYVTKVISFCFLMFPSTPQVDLGFWNCKLGNNRKSDVQNYRNAGKEMNNSFFYLVFCNNCAKNLNGNHPISKTAARKCSNWENFYSDVRSNGKFF